jgi:hypothetical protein
MTAFPIRASPLQVLSAIALYLTFVICSVMVRRWRAAVAKVMGRSRTPAALKMHWIRSNIRFGSRVALVALALQIVLSFGHVHLCAADPDAPAQVSIGTAAGGADQGPTNKADGADDAFCPLCASMQLIAGSVTAAGPALPLPAQLGSTGFQAPAEPALLPSLRALFNARAPPPV